MLALKIGPRNKGLSTNNHAAVALEEPLQHEAQAPPYLRSRATESRYLGFVDSLGVQTAAHYYVHLLAPFCLWGKK